MTRLMHRRVILVCLLVLHTLLFAVTSTALSTPTTPAEQLRSLLQTSLSTQRAIPLPGVHDALSAKLFASHVPCLFLSGFGVSASRLGQPDAGILTLSEMEDATRNVVSSVFGYNTRIPVMVDGDTGYGSIRRTVRGLASAGAAAITIEDQEFPKRCTYAAGGGVKVVSRDESRERIAAAVAAANEVRETGKDVLIVARTDCRMAVVDGGFREAVERCVMFQELGADVVYAENLQSREEYELLRRELGDSTPLMLAQVQLHGNPNPNQGGGTAEQSLYSVTEVGELGYQLALFGVTGLQSVVSALEGAVEDFVTGDGLVLEDASANLSTFDNVKRVVGFDELDEFDAKISRAMK